MSLPPAPDGCINALSDEMTDLSTPPWSSTTPPPIRAGLPTLESSCHERDPVPFPIVGHQARSIDAEIRGEIIAGVAIALIRETRVGLR